MGQSANGAHYEIMVDGKPRSYRDAADIAIQAAKYLKERHPMSDVLVRDMRDNSATAIGWEKGLAFVRA